MSDDAPQRQRQQPQQRQIRQDSTFPEDFRPLPFEGYVTLNVKSPRPSIRDEELAWCDGWMPLAPNNIRTLPDLGPAVFSLSPPPPPPMPRAVHFDGLATGLYIAAALRGAPDSYVGIGSYWFKSESPGGTGGTMFASAIGLNGSSLPSFENAGANSIELQNLTSPGLTLSNDPSGTPFASNFPTTADLNDAVWHSLIYGWNSNFGAGSKVLQIVLDGVLQTPIILDTLPAFIVPYTNVNGTVLGFGGFDSSTNPQGLVEMDVTEFYLDTQHTADLSVPTNVQKWRTVAGHPANLGADGSTPLGALPTIYNSIDATGPASQFATDRSGHANTWTINGPLIRATTDPF